jgi:hypothetical protein
MCKNSHPNVFCEENADLAVLVRHIVCVHSICSCPSRVSQHRVVSNGAPGNRHVSSWIDTAIRSHHISSGINTAIRMVQPSVTMASPHTTGSWTRKHNMQSTTQVGHRTFHHCICTYFHPYNLNFVKYPKNYPPISTKLISILELCNVV